MPEQNEPFSHEQDFHENGMRIYELINSMEAWARLYSEDYANELDDGCIASVGSIDLGGEITTEVKYSAERYREQLPSGVPGRAMTAVYDITSSIIRRCPDFASFPENFKEYVVEEFDGEYDMEELHSYGEIFSIEFEQKYSLTADGSFEYEHALFFLVGEDKIEISDVQLEPDQQVELSDKDLNDELFSKIFSGDEMIVISGAVKAIEHERSSAKILETFIEKAAGLDHVTGVQRMNMMEQLADSIFTESDKAA